MVCYRKEPVVKVLYLQYFKCALHVSVKKTVLDACLISPLYSNTTRGLYLDKMKGFINKTEAQRHAIRNCLRHFELSYLNNVIGLSLMTYVNF